MTNGQPFVTLTAGYFGSIAIGSGLIMAAFDTSASKVAALIVYPALIVSFWFGHTWARLRTLVCIGVSIGIWFSVFGCLRGCVGGTFRSADKFRGTPVP